MKSISPAWLAAGVLALGLAGAARSADKPIPQKISVKEGKAVKLFNGSNLDGWDTVTNEDGVNNDVRHVFTVENGAVHVSGDGFGHFMTKDEYSDYHLSWEFKWGENTYRGRKDKARDSGMLFHCVNGTKIPVWGKSIEFQIIEGGTGDCIPVDKATHVVNGERTSKRQDRWGKGEWKDVVGYRDPANEVEKPHGEWNRCDVVADGDSAKYYVNGKLVNELHGLEPTKGKILFQTEGAELYFRNIELRPLKK